MTTPYLPATPLPDEDWWRDDAALRRFLEARLPASELKALEARLVALGRAAPHELDALAPDGEVVLGDAYRRIQRLARDHRVFTLAWHPLGDAPRASRVATFALGYLFGQAEAGYYCPACMTDAAAFVLDRHAPPALAARYVPRLVQDDVEGAFEGAMFLTERAGGSDVGATATTAAPASDGTWRLTGDKWFCSNANAEATLALARVPGAPDGTRGLGLFVLPSRLADGRPNPGVRRVRLKEKLGVRSMATAEVELRDAHAEMIAPPPDGFKAMVEMVNLSRLYNAVTSVSIARRALSEGQKNGSWRVAFGKRLREHPLYARAVAELAVDVRGALWFVLDTADAFDKAARGDERAYRLLRALTPLAKAETAKLSVRAASEACEMLGGNGYVEQWVTPRLLRDAQVLPIWEGTTNVQTLDFLRALAKDGAAEALVADSLARLADAPDARALVAAWRAWGSDVAEARAPAEREIAARRHLEEAYHLRCATLLLEDALRDGEPGARLFAEAYATRHVARDARAWERLVASSGGALAQWP